MVVSESDLSRKGAQIETAFLIQGSLTQRIAWRAVTLAKAGAEGWSRPALGPVSLNAVNESAHRDGEIFSFVTQNLLFPLVEID
jgi:hypothetical protein